MNGINCIKKDQSLIDEMLIYISGSYIRVFTVLMGS